MTYSVLKVPLNPNQPTNHHLWTHMSTGITSDTLARAYIAFLSVSRLHGCWAFLFLSCVHRAIACIVYWKL